VLVVPKSNKPFTPEEEFCNRNCQRNQICGQNVNDRMELSQTSFCNLNGVIQSHALLLPSLPTVVAKGKFFSNHNVGGQSQAQVLVRVL